MLRLLIFIPIFLFSQETFVLPDEADHLMQQLNVHILKAEKKVFVLTSHLDDYTFMKNLKRLAKQDIPVVIITQAPISKDDQVLRLSVLNNISIFSLTPFNGSKANKGSLVCIDDKELFLLSSDIRTQEMNNTYAFSMLKKQRCNDIFTTLLARSSLY